MRTLRPLLLALPLVLAGCLLTTGQIIIDFELSQLTVSTNAVESEDVDLNDIDDYRDHKDKLDGLADLALLGEITNTGAGNIDVEAWITRGFTSYTTDAQVRANGIRTWGPLRVNAGQTVRIGWDESAGLFTPTGKAVLLEETQGDGQFTVYVIGAAGTYSFVVNDGVLVVVMEAGL